VGGSTGRGVIDHRDAQRAIEAVWDELVSDGRAGLVTLLRLAQQRYVTDTVGDPFTLAPIVAVTFCGDHDVGQHDRPSYGASVGKAVREVVLAWLRGIAVAGWEHHQLRQRVRDRILSTDPESYDEFAVEALAMLGPDINDATENWLRQVAAAAPHRLQPAVESVGVALSMPWFGRGYCST
jgi:hypothetical protein